LTYISSTYEPQNAEFASVDSESEQSIASQPEQKRNLFSFFQFAGWEPLCPDLMREISVGLGRQD
jgi:hypothetical protein